MPVVGRDEPSARIRAAIDDPGTSLVLVAGEAGVGKTCLLEQVTAGDDAVRVWGDAAMAHIPLAAVVHLVERASGTLADLIGQVARVVPEGGLLVVDDIDQCDELSMALVMRLVRSRRCTVAATVRTHDGVLPGKIAALAHERGASLITVVAFTRAEADAMVEMLLADAVDAALSREVWRRSAGNALFIGQLIGEARALGAIERTLAGWVMVRPLEVPTGLRQMLLSRLESVDDAAASAARFLAGAGRLEVSQIERAGLAAGFDAMAAAGIATFDGSVARFAHPLYAEVIWGALTPLQRRVVLREHVELERTSPSPDLVRIAVLALDAGQTPDPRGLLSAARLANAGGAADQARRLAQAAMSLGEGELLAEAATVAAGAEAELGLVDEAIETLSAALAVVEPGPAAVVLAVTLHEITLWARFDQASAAQVLRTQAQRYGVGSPLVTAAFAVAEADGLAYDGRAGEAIGVLDQVPECGDLPPAVASMLATSRAHATTLLGRSHEAIGIATAAHEQVMSELESSVPGARCKHLVIASHALREHGRLADAVDHAERAHAAGLEQGIVVGRAWAALNAAAAWLQIGHLDTAATWARRGLVAASAARVVDCERLAIGVLCIASASRGRSVEQQLLDRLAELPVGIGFLLSQLPIAQGWLTHAEGSPALAATIMAEGQRRAAETQAVSSEAWILHERLRMGERIPVAERLAELPGRGPLALARISLARGIEGQSLADLMSAGEQFEALGSALFAAEAFAVAARLAHGRTSVATARRAEALAAGIGRPTTPLLRGMATDPLSPRERLTAELAARGSTNAVIASELGLSIRTVENHLASTYTKLGITSRRELPTALRVMR